MLVKSPVCTPVKDRGVRIQRYIVFLLSSTMFATSRSLFHVLILVNPSLLYVLVNCEVHKPGSFSLPLHKRPKTLGRRLTGETSVLSFASGQEWMTQVDIGGQSLNLLVDTGSADLWVMSTFMNQSAQISHNENNIYNPTHSSTWKLQPSQHFRIEYGNGGWGGSGPVGQEVVKVGNVSVIMQIGAANATESIPNGIYDGFLGLAFKGGNSIRPVQQLTFMETLQHTLDQPVFAMNFQANAIQTMDFGFVNHTVYEGNLVNVPVDNSTSAWTITQVSAVAVKGVAYAGKAQNMIFDSGGETMFIDAATASHYWSQVPGAQNPDPGVSENIGYPCSAGASLPDLTLRFGTATSSGDEIIIPGRFFASTQSSWNGNPDMCAAGLISYPDVDRINAGYPFYNSHYIVYNQSAPSVSFASFAGLKADPSGSTDEPVATVTVSIPGTTSAIGTGNSNSGYGSASPSTSRLSGGFIALVVIAVLAIVALSVLAVLCFKKRQRRKAASVIYPPGTLPTTLVMDESNPQHMPKAFRYA